MQIYIPCLFNRETGDLAGWYNEYGDPQLYNGDLSELIFKIGDKFNPLLCPSKEGAIEALKDLSTGGLSTVVQGALSVAFDNQCLSNAERCYPASISKESIGELHLNPASSGFIKVKQKPYSVIAELRDRNSSPKKVSSKLDQVIYITNEENRIIITGVAGDICVIDDIRFCKTYTIKGKRIIPSVIDQLMDRLKSEGRESCRIRVDTFCEYKELWAKQINKAEYTELELNDGRIVQINDPKIDHGDGDWILAEDVEGEPNIDTIECINGLLFYSMFDVVK